MPMPGSQRLDTLNIVYFFTLIGGPSESRLLF
jgi:hypothetical protein